MSLLSCYPPAQLPHPLVHLSPVGGSVRKGYTEMAGARRTGNFYSCGIGVGGWSSGFKGCTNTAGESGTMGLGATDCPRPTVAPCSSRGCSRRSRSSDTGTSRPLSAWTSCGTSPTTAWSTGARTHRAWRRPAASSSNGSPSCAGRYGASAVGVSVAGQPGPTLSPTCPQVCASGPAGTAAAEDQRTAPLLPGPRLPGDAHGQPEGCRLDSHQVPGTEALGAGALWAGWPGIQA